MRKKRSHEMEVIQIVLSVAIAVMTVILFFKSSELTILFPAVFGLAAVLSVICALEGIAYSRDRIVKKSRIVVFFVLALILAGLTFVSLKTVLMK